MSDKEAPRLCGCRCHEGVPLPAGCCVHALAPMTFKEACDASPNELLPFDVVFSFTKRIHERVAAAGGSPALPVSPAPGFVTAASHPADNGIRRIVDLTMDLAAANSIIADTKEWCARNGDPIACAKRLEADLAAAREQIAALSGLLRRALNYVGIGVEAVEDDPKTGEGHETEEYILVDKLRDEIEEAIR